MRRDLARPLRRISRAPRRSGARGGAARAERGMGGGAAQAPENDLGMAGAMTRARALNSAGKRHSGASLTHPVRPPGMLARTGSAERSGAGPVRPRAASFQPAGCDVVPAPGPAPALSSPVPMPVPNDAIQGRRARAFHPGPGGETAAETAFETPKCLARRRKRRRFQSFTVSPAREYACARPHTRVRTTIYNFETGETLRLGGGVPPFFGFTAGFIGAAARETNKIGGGYV